MLGSSFSDRTTGNLRCSPPWGIGTIWCWACICRVLLWPGSWPSPSTKDPVTWSTQTCRVPPRGLRWRWWWWWVAKRPQYILLRVFNHACSHGSLARTIVIEVCEKGTETIEVCEDVFVSVMLSLNSTETKTFLLKTLRTLTTLKIPKRNMKGSSKR